MKLVTFSLIVLAFFTLSTLNAADNSISRLMILKNAFDQCPGPQTLTLEKLSTLPNDCVELIRDEYLKQAQTEARKRRNAKRKAQRLAKKMAEERDRENRVSCMSYARTFN